MSKPTRIDRAVIAPKYPVEMSCIAWLLSDRINIEWVSVFLAMYVIGHWFYVWQIKCTTKEVGIFEDCS